jgi:hypothetical protein
VTRPLLNRRLHGLGSSIFGVMSARAVATNSVNLGQGIPDVDGPPGIARAATSAGLQVNQLDPVSCTSIGETDLSIPVLDGGR